MTKMLLAALTVTSFFAGYFGMDAYLLRSARQDCLVVPYPVTVTVIEQIGV